MFSLLHKAKQYFVFGETYSMKDAIEGLFIFKALLFNPYYRHLREKPQKMLIHYNSSNSF
jgi:hypothetical protein